MSEQAALPVVEQSTGASAQQLAEPSQHEAQGTQQEGEADPGESGQQTEKKEKSPEQREIERQNRKIDRLVRQREELRAQVGKPLPTVAQQDNNQATEGHSDTLTLSRAEMQQALADAEKRGQSAREQSTEIEQRAKIVEGLSKEWGSDKFDALARDLNEAFDGLTDRSGKPKPATEAIFKSGNPKALIEYLADPDNADEAEAISRLSGFDLGIAIGEVRVKAQAKSATDKPQPSRVPAPIEAGRGSGKSTSAMPDPSNTKAYMKWANEQERRRA